MFCVLPAGSVYVHVNVIPPKNEQDRFTAERVARTRPKTYRAIVKLLADSDAKVLQIAKLHHVSEHNGARNQRARDYCDSRPKTAVGIDLCGGVPVQINLQMNAQALQDRYAEIVRKIEARGTGEQSAESKESLTNGETVSLQSGEELPKAIDEYLANRLPFRALTSLLYQQSAINFSYGRGVAPEKNFQESLDAILRSAVKKGSLPTICAHPHRSLHWQFFTTKPCSGQASP